MSLELPYLSTTSTDVLSTTNLAPVLDEGSLTSSLTGLGRSNQSLLFVDRSVTDYEQLLAGVTTGTEIHVLDPGQDAVTQITNTLLGRQNIASLHIVSHGEAGGVDFGSNALKLTDLPQYAAQLKTWSKALTNDADILFYGCNVAEGQLGQAFVQNISQLTGADIAASDDLTGSASNGGNWNLEYHTGPIESSLAFQSSILANYQTTLAIGPDAAGYIAASTAFDATLNLVPGATDVVTLPNSSNTDDSGIDALDLGTNTFRFYGQNYTGANQLFVTANGLITFGSANSKFTNDGMGTGSALSQAAIGIVWDDWYTKNNTAPDDLVLYKFQDTNSDGTPDNLVIESNNVRHFSFRTTTDPAQNATYQMILELNTGAANGNIIFNYTDLTIPGTTVDEAGSATVGIKAAGTSSPTNLIISQDTTSSPYIGTGRAVLITSHTPLLDLNGDSSQATSGINYNVVFNQGEGAVTLVDSAIGLLDPDSSNLASAGIILTNRPDGTLESLAAVTTGTNITASYNSSNGLLSLSGSDTIAHYRQVLSSVTYNNTTGNPNATTRLVNFTVSDGIDISSVATTTIGINAPKIDLNGPINGIDYTAYRPGTSAVSIVSATGLTISDVNDATLTSATVSITNLRNSPSEVLVASTTGTSIVANYDTTSGVLTLSGSDTLANYQQVLRTITYNNASASPDTRDRLIAFTVNDGVNASPIATSTLKYGTPPAPTISTNTLTISESGTVVLSSSNLNAADVDSTPAELTYTVTTATRGRFEFVSAPGVAVTSFTQAQINAGQVQFVDDGSETAPTYIIRVSDGTTNSGTSTVTIPGGGFTNVNDTPIVSTNTLSVSEGGSVVLSSSDINATDPDNTAAQLTYTASSISGGQFEFLANAGVAITSFTQAEVNSGAVQFVHSGGETAPSYSLIANDGALSSDSSTVAIGTFTNVNDAPTISTNSLTLSEGGSVVLSSSDINATDDNTPAQLTYTASSISGGRFELVANAGVAITSFTQPQINSGAVRFVHGGGETAPSYSLIVNDGLLSSGSSTVAIGTFTNVNDAPTISTNVLTLSEGGSVVLSSSNINATDDNTPAELTYTASSINGGRFELVANAGVAITSFTQAQINSGAVRFVHAGGETAPSYSLIVRDGSLSSGSSTVTIGTFTNVNDAPTISANSLSVSEGSSVVLSISNINAIDPDNTPAQLTYTASSISGGQFELVATPSVAITSFTQAQINSGAVRFVHDGGETAPSYSLIVNDGSLNSGSSTVTLGTFTNVNDAPTISTNSLSLSEGSSVVLSSSNINATDPDNTPAQLTYTASSISGGRFELVANAGVAITSFTQAEINSGAVRFVQDGGETAPSYSLSVSDGLLSSGSSIVTMGTFTNVNDAPTLTGNATLAAVTENTNNPSGSTLTSLFGSLFSDPDIGTSLSGLAIVGNTATTQGRWEYSTDGTTWASVGAVADDATALAFSASTLVRFVPAIGYDGIPPGLTVRALDNSYSGRFTNGTTRATINTTTNGGTTAIAGTTVLLDTSVTQSLSNLLWRKSDTGENVVWQLNDFVFQSGYSLAKVSDPNWEIADTADFNADGIADILWRNKASGENVIWEMNNTGYETDHSITKVADPNWQIAGTADFNADGTADILWRNKASGENAIWEMNGFTVQTGHSITQVSDPNWQIADTADFNADGTADILWRNKASGENAIWEMNGFTVQTGHSITQVSNPNWQIAGTGDFNADGTDDILWRNKTSGENVIWKMNDFSLQTGQLITQVSDPNWQIAGVADLGSDSTPEILWYNKPTGNQVIWEMSSLTNPQPYQLPDVSNPNWSVKPVVPVKPFMPA